MYCPNCGTQVNDGTQVCPNCGYVLAAANPGSAPNQNGQMNGQPINYQQPSDGSGKGLAIASMVLGIVSIIMIFISSPIGLVCAIVGLVLAIISKSKGYNGGMRTAGFVCSIITLAIFVLSIIACLACFGGILGAADSLGGMLGSM